MGRYESMLHRNLYRLRVAETREDKSMYFKTKLVYETRLVETKVVKLIFNRPGVAGAVL